MAQAKRARTQSSRLKVSSSGRRAKNARDHYHSISNKRRFFTFIAVFAVIVILTGVAMANSFKQLNELNREKALLVGQKESLEMTSERLTEEVAYTNTREFIEYTARRLLGWINPSDKKYIIVED